MKLTPTKAMIAAGATIVHEFGATEAEAPGMAADIYAAMEDQRQLDLASERIRSGLKKSTVKRSQNGPVPKPVPDKVIELLQTGKYSIREIEEMTGVNRGKIHRASKQLKEKSVEDLV
jgi:hypothetical protein